MTPQFRILFLSLPTVLIGGAAFLAVLMARAGWKRGQRGALIRTWGSQRF